MRAAIITISTSLSQGQGVDESGPALVELAREPGRGDRGDRGRSRRAQSKIEWALRHYADSEDCDLVLTTGGTGFSPDDVTPEATRAVIDREAPGIAEAMRAASRPHTANWMLSRAVAGIRKRTLIVNFPGSPKSIRQVGEEIGPALPHAIALLTRSAGRARPWRLSRPSPAAGDPQTSGVERGDPAATTSSAVTASARRCAESARSLDSRTHARGLRPERRRQDDPPANARDTARPARGNRARARLGPPPRRLPRAAARRVPVARPAPLPRPRRAARTSLFYARLYDVPDAGRAHRAPARGRRACRGARTSRCATSRAGWRSASRSAGRCCTRPAAAAAGRAARAPRPGGDRDGRRPRSARAAATTRVLVTHDLEHGLAEADRVLALRDGYVVTDAPAQRGHRRRPAHRLQRRRMRAIATILRKDLVVELRTKESVPVDGAVRGHHVRDLPFRARPRPPRGRAGRRACCG